MVILVNRRTGKPLMTDDRVMVFRGPLTADQWRVDHGERDEWGVVKTYMVPVIESSPQPLKPGMTLLKGSRTFTISHRKQTNDGWWGNREESIGLSDRVIQHGDWRIQ